MAQRSVTRRGPSGDVVAVSWDGAKLISEVAGVRFAGGSYGRGFQIHPAGAHDFACENVVDDGATLDSRVMVGRREVKIAKSADKQTTIATLIGSHHELMTIFQGPAPAAATIGELFGALDIDDAAEGMRCVAKDATLLTVMNEHIVLVNEDSTSLDVPSPALASQIVPGHRGGKTRHGEVWRTLLPGRKGQRAHDFTYVVGTPRGAADVVAASTDGISDKDLLAMVDSVNVEWSGRQGKGRNR